VATYQETLSIRNRDDQPPWMDVQQQGTVVYFLYASPAQILRYDLKSGTWLAPVALAAVPTAFRAAAEGVYVAFGKTLSRYTLDLSSSVHLATSSAPTLIIFVNGNYFYLFGSSDFLNGTITSYRKSNGSKVSSTSVDAYLANIVVSSVLGKAYAFVGQASLGSMTLNPDGTVGALNSAPAILGERFLYGSPGGMLVFDSGGAVYNGADLSLVGSTGAYGDDLCLLPDGNLVIARGNVVTLYAPGCYAELGRATLPNGVLRIFPNGSTVVCFSLQAPTDAGVFEVQQVTEAQLLGSPRSAAPVVPPSSASFVPDDAFVGIDGNLYLFSKLFRSIFAWSPATRQYVTSIPLVGSARFISYSPVLNRVYLAYDDGLVTKIDLGVSTHESSFATMPPNLVSFSAVDSQVYSCVAGAYSDSWAQLLYRSDGTLAAANVTTANITVGIAPSQSYWNSAMHAVYDFPSSKWVPIEMVPIAPGMIDPTVDPPVNYSENGNGPGPIRFSIDGSELVTGSGAIFNSTTLLQVGALNTPIFDATWPGATLSGLVILGSSAAMEQWNGEGEALPNPVPVPGYPLRLWSTPSGQLLALTEVGGTPSMTLMTASGYVLSPNGPDITSQPVGQTVNTGSTVVFSAAAPGAVTYQWQFDGTNLTDSSNVFGANGPQLVLEDIGKASAGSYTCVVTDAGGSNYTNSASLTIQAGATPGLLSSTSARALVGSKNGPLTSGFVIAGKTSRTVLVQALGPALAPAPYNVAAPLQHPALSIHQAQNGKDVVLYSNAGWGTNPVLLGTAAKLSALPALQPGAADSEILATLPPGNYTAEVSGADGGTGVALVAIYELP
jgi:hypothetical protein